LMRVTFGDIPALTTRAKNYGFAAKAAASLDQEEILISDTTGFHIYGDLDLNLGLAAAVDQKKANLYLEVLEDYAQIASDFVEVNPGAFVFEVQGERIHLFLNAPNVDAGSVQKLFELCFYFTHATNEIIKPKVGEYWGGFCMAADHGRAIVLSTGREGDDSLISLGRPANAPAKHLAQTPGVSSGHLAIPFSMAQAGGKIDFQGERAVNRGWVQFDLLNFKTLQFESTRVDLMVETFAKSAATSKTAARRVVALAAKRAEVISTEGATVQNPAAVQAFFMRADLDGFTRRVDDAFEAAGHRKDEQGQEPLKRLVLEFIQIMKIPDAFEAHSSSFGSVIRLPWAGDCYNAVILPRDDENFDLSRAKLPALAPLSWFDPDGQINAKRDPVLAAVAKQNEWSIGIAGGEESQGRLLLANITTAHRQFLIAAGWGVRRSLDAQSGDGLKANESAIHKEDHSPLDEPFKDAYKGWTGNGPTTFRKATAVDLRQARDCSMREKTKPAPTPVRSPAIVIPSAKPYCEYRNTR